LQIWNGGIHIYGALIFGTIALLIYLRLHKLPYLVYLDGISLGLLLGQAIGRLGNFINQELYGPPTTLPWGLRIDPIHRVPPYNNLSQYPESVRFQPLFLYELVWDALGFALLFWISRRFEKRLRDGDLLLMYLIWAPTGRFFIEFYRTDSWFFPGTPFNILHVLIAIIVLSASSILVLRFIRRGSDSSTPGQTGGSSEVAQSTSEVALKTAATDQVSTSTDGEPTGNPGIGSLGTEG
jgi:phosphatidylglycerol:prolipoprotein diacylglycerol transferase